MGMQESRCASMTKKREREVRRQRMPAIRTTRNSLFLMSGFGLFCMFGMLYDLVLYSDLELIVN